jgi:hypothetical protein
LLRPGRLCGVEFPVALFDAASPLVPSDDDADMVRASALASGGDFLLRLAGCQGKDPISQGRRRALAASGFCGRGAPARSLWSSCLSRRGRDLAEAVFLGWTLLVWRASTRSVASNSLSWLVSLSRCASTRASASPTRCFSFVISSNVDILYLRDRV